MTTSLCDNSDHLNDTIVVGFAFPSKKLKSMPFLNEVLDGVEFCPIDLEESLEQQGPFDIILHKMSHDMVFSRNDPSAAARVEKLYQYVKSHSNIVTVDRFDSVKDLTSRAKICDTLYELAETMPSIHYPRYVVAVDPNKTITEEVIQSDLKFPVICKTVDACATEASHFVSIAVKPQDLDKLLPPMVIQEFVNHGGRLFKAYVLGDDVFIYERPSLPNFPVSNASGITFDTQKPYPLCKVECESPSIDIKQPSPDIPSIQEGIKQIARVLSNKFKLSLFGFDIIQDESNGNLLIVDLNYFPSYTELLDFPKRLRNHLRKLVYKAS